MWITLYAGIYITCDIISSLHDKVLTIGTIIPYREYRTVLSISRTACL